MQIPTFTTKSVKPKSSITH